MNEKNMKTDLNRFDTPILVSGGLMIQTGSEDWG